MPQSEKKYLLVYDAECGPCSKFKRVINWLDKYRRLDYISLVRADQLGLLSSIPLSRRHRSFHLISPSGTSSGSAAIPELLTLLPLGRGAASIIRSVLLAQMAVNFLYRTTSRLHDSSSCGYSPLDTNLDLRSEKLEETNEVPEKRFVRSFFISLGHY